MKKQLILLTIAGLTVISCGGKDDDLAAKASQQYEIVQEGSAAGAPSTLGATPPLTGTNADTTSAFTLDPNAVASSGGPGTIAGTLPPPMTSATNAGGAYGTYSTPSYGSSAPSAPRRTVTPQRSEPSQASAPSQPSYTPSPALRRTEPAQPEPQQQPEPAQPEPQPAPAPTDSAASTDTQAPPPQPSEAPREEPKPKPEQTTTTPPSSDASTTNPQ